MSTPNVGSAGFNLEAFTKAETAERKKKADEQLALFEARYQDALDKREFQSWTGITSDWEGAGGVSLGIFQTVLSPIHAVTKFAGNILGNLLGGISGGGLLGRLFGGGASAQPQVMMPTGNMTPQQQQQYLQWLQQQQRAAGGNNGSGSTVETPQQKIARLEAELAALKKANGGSGATGGADGKGASGKTGGSGGLTLNNLKGVSRFSNLSGYSYNMDTLLQMADDAKGAETKAKADKAAAQKTLDSNLSLTALMNNKGGERISIMGNQSAPSLDKRSETTTDINHYEEDRQLVSVAKYELAHAEAELAQKTQLHTDLTAQLSSIASQISALEQAQGADANKEAQTAIAQLTAQQTAIQTQLKDINLDTLRKNVETARGNLTKAEARLADTKAKLKKGTDNKAPDVSAIDAKYKALDDKAAEIAGADVTKGVADTRLKLADGVLDALVGQDYTIGTDGKKVTKDTTGGTRTWSKTGAIAQEYSNITKGGLWKDGEYTVGNADRPGVDAVRKDIDRFKREYSECLDANEGV